MGVSERGETVARIKRKHSEASIYLITDFSEIFLMPLEKVLPVLTFKMTAVLKSHYQRLVN